MYDERNRKRDQASGCALLVIYIIVAIIAFICLGPEAALKYLCK
jgi:hypothetical protein